MADSIFPIPAASVPLYWPTAASELARAFDYSAVETPAEHLAQLMAGHEQLWHIAGAAWAVTRICEGKYGRVFEFRALAGREMNTWKAQFFAAAEAWAKERGCVCAVFTGRTGWRKALPDYGVIRLTMKKEL